MYSLKTRLFIAPAKMMVLSKNEKIKSKEARISATQELMGGGNKALL